MTEVITRTPLDPLSMSATQEGRRRSARRAFDEEDTRPAKKAKTDDAPSKPVKQANGRKTAPTSKKAKASYDEDADGFQFSRAKSKKATSKPPAETEPSSTQEAQNHGSNKQPKRGRPRKASLETPDDEPRQATPKKRRSARLSGENEQTQPDQQSSEKQNGTAHSDELRVAKTPSSGDLRVQKKRAPTKIALPFADTPVIMRNKEMRKESSEGRRRSSSGMRGRRASSLIDSGASNGEIDHTQDILEDMPTELYTALPHSEVEISDFYKHIHQDLSEPRRMKQLLVWCGARALPPRPTGSTEDVNAVLAARTIQEELLRDFSNRNEMSDWFNREDIAPTALVKKPNPQNQQNASKLQELEQEVKRLKAEETYWDNLLGSLESTSKQQHSVEDMDPSKPPNTSQVDIKALDETDQSSILQDMESHQGHIESSRVRFKAVTGPLEYQMDTFADGVHKMEKLRESSDATVDKILSQASDLLQKRDETASTSAGTEKVGIGDLLRSLSRAS